jgi:starch phosphorylase
VSPRRWLRQINPGLSQLISGAIGEGWVKDLGRLEGLAGLAEDPAFQGHFAAVKAENKRRLAAYIGARSGIAVDPAALFDVQIKRIHEYKRQLLKLIYLISLYNRLRDDPGLDSVPRVAIFAGKAAPGYRLAKLIVQLINAVADRVNRDPDIGDRLKLVFLRNYDVTLAERVVPAANLSEQISTAGWEASGTGNMKLSLNGALTIGTLDGANIEIREAVGAGNFFAFGLGADEAAALHGGGYAPLAFYGADQRLRQAIEQIRSGFFAPSEDPGLFAPIAERLTDGGDPFLVLADFAAYAACQGEVERVYRDGADWTARAIRNVAAMGRFSSDRAIRQYAREVWEVEPLHQSPRGPAAHP